MTGARGGERRSLAGAQVVVTRPESAGGRLSRLLAERGARVLRWPAIAFAPPDDPAPLAAALARLGSYDWIVFTSPRAVAAVSERTPPPPAERPRVAAVGESTARDLAAAGWRVDLVPASHSGAALLAAFEAVYLAGAKVLLPASSMARDLVPRGLRARGAAVDEVVAYRTVAARLDAEACLASIGAAPLSIVTFASPSAVDGLARALGRPAFQKLLAGCPAVAIGPTTARALESAGVAVAATADPSTLSGLARAVERVARNGKDD